MPGWPLLSYVSLMSVTPGPNNLMLASSGVRFGFRRTVPHMLGISLGHGVQVAAVAGMLGWVMSVLADWRLLMSLAGCGYLFWLSWQIWRSSAPAAGQVARPMSLLGAAAFQWVNPKAWVMVVNTSLLFLPAGAGWPQALQLAGWCAAINLPCIGLWAVLGDVLRQALTNDRQRRLFNAVMAGLMLLTAIWLLQAELALAGGQ